MPLVMLLVFAFTLFCSATLLFLIEPMVGKMMLPLLGGTPAVWNTCMVFFQAILLAGYAYSHATTQWLGARRQARLQLAVMFLPLISFILNAAFFTGLLSPNEQLIAGREGNPIPALLLVLTLSVGLPMFVVCTSAPLLTRWFSSTDHPAAQDPYFLYGASNLGSMLMLIGYPLLVEPYLSLKGQQVVWVIGYGLLSVCIAGCAVLMWKSRPAAEPALAGPDPNVPSSTAIKQAEVSIANRPRGQIQNTPHVTQSIDDLGPDQRPVDWIRRLRWITLALIPSSLMLGVTTFITTDIAAIPLLWVAPLTLYLLTFIIVFAHISAFQQAIFTMVGTVALVALLVLGVAPAYIQNDNLLWLLRVCGLGICIFSYQILKVRDNHLIHRVMIMVMPLLVLLLLFMMLSEIKPGNTVNICLHLATLLIVSMVCHGELALDRPEPKHLTEFFLLMSVGGVVGGLFNALVAPITFNSLVEYPLMMMVACLMLPPLGINRESIWARRADLALATFFLIVGGTLLFLRSREGLPDLAPLKDGPWKQGTFALLAGIGLGSVAAWKGWGNSGESYEADEPEPNHWIDRTLDVVLPLALLVLVVGLSWGLPTHGVYGRLSVFAGWFKISSDQFRIILTFGLPAVLCYTFVERSLRFGLGVGAILLGCGFCALLAEPPLHQERSFFGVLRVEEGRNTRDQFSYDFNRLVHGTTLHGKQFTDKALRDTPLSYYHRTGPVGNIFRLYNTDPKRAMAVIGLGTGTMASYGLPGQTVDFFDIDPVVVDISFDTDEYFTFIEDAEIRGADINLILGDARLTFQPKGIKTRFKPLHRRKAVRPERTLGTPLEEDFKYRLLVVDAFSSDAIPIHLITKQAVQIYFDRMQPGGIVCMHISNRYLDLQPVLANIADELGIVGYHSSDDENGAAGKNRSHWVALARKKEDLDRLFYRPRWENNADQLSLLGLASWPSAGTALSSCSGLAFACQAIAEQQSRLLAKEEGLPGKPSEVRGDWIPLDQPSLLEKNKEEAESRVAEIDQQLARIASPLKDAKKRGTEAKKPLEEARKLVNSIRKELEQLRISFSLRDDKEKPKWTPAQTVQMDKKKKELDERIARLEHAQQEAERALAPLAWYEKIEKHLKARKERYQARIEATPKKIITARRVGVWTDDYSNLLAVFSW